MNEALASQGRAVGISAANSRLRTLTLHAPAAFGAHSGNLHRLFCTSALIAHHAQHLGNNLTGLIDNNTIANANILSLNKILVMQRSTANYAAAEPHRRQHSRGR